MGNRPRAAPRGGRAAALAVAFALAAPALAGQPAPDDPVVLEVRVVAGPTGEPLAGAVVRHGARGDGRAAPAFEDAGGLHRRAIPGLERRRAGATVRFHLDLPAGWAAEGGTEIAERPPAVSIFARAVRLQVVAWPAVRVTARVVDGTGAPVAGARVRFSRVAPPRGPASATAAARARVSDGATDSGGDGGVAADVPDVPGARHVLSATLGRRTARSEPFRLPPAEPARERTLVLSEEPERYEPREPASWELECGGGLGPAPAPPPKGEASLAVRVLRAGREPARGAAVVVAGGAPAGTDPSRAGGVDWTVTAATDDGGVARFAGLRAGGVSVWVREPGFFQERAVEVDLADASPAETEVVEDADRPFTLRVFDERGEPRPGATVTLSGEPVVDGDGVQHVDFVTDSAGAVRLPRVPRFQAVATASLGGRSRTTYLPGREIEVTLRGEGE